MKATPVTAAKPLQVWRKPKMLTCSDKRPPAAYTGWLKSTVSTSVPCGDHIHRNPAQRRGSLRQNCHAGSRPPAKTHTSQTAGTSILQPHHKLRGTTGPACPGECHYLKGIICHSAQSFCPCVYLILQFPLQQRKQNPTA